MKKRIKTIIAALFLAILTLGGCSCGSCVNCFDGCFKNCASGVLEFFGAFNKCTGCICEGFMGEECYEHTFVGPCYTGANCSRNCDDPNCNVLYSLINSDDSSHLTTDSYDLNVTFGTSEIKNLKYYYSIEVKVEITVLIDVKDVVVKLSVSDSNGNIQNGLLIYVDDDMKSGESATATARLTFAKPMGAGLPSASALNVDSSNVFGRL